MEAYEIDDLLKQVSPELLVGYENKNLTEGTLMGVNEKYKLITKKWERLFHLWVKVLVFLMITAVLLLGLAWWTDIPPFYITGLLFGLVGIFIPSFVFLDKKVEEFRETLNWCRSILEDFRQSVEGMDPTWRSPSDRYNGESVRETLVGFTVRLLDAEKKCGQVCSLRASGKVPTSDVVHYSNFEQKCRDELEDMLRAVEEFGLAFDKGDLFEDARKHLERVS